MKEAKSGESRENNTTLGCKQPHERLRRPRCQQRRYLQVRRLGQLIDADQATQNSYDYEAFGSVYGSPTGEK
jgi:hypothetical protein